MSTATARAIASPASGRRWLRFIIDHNPCYLLSATCMLTGCYLLNSALYTPAGDVRKLAAVLLVVNLYEACVILLARTLIRFPLVQRDAWIVLFVEALFLTDITFVGGVISTVDPAWGVAISAVLLAMASLKIRVILRLLRVRQCGRTLGFILLQIVVLLGVPIVFKRLSLPNHGWLSPVAVYLSWWVAGLIPVIGTILWARKGRGRPANEDQTLPDQVLCGLYVVIPFASLLLHLHGAAWVYDVPFSSAFLAPVVLGMAVSLRLAETLIARHRIVALQGMLVVIAILLSVQFPPSLSFRLDRLLSISVSPLRLTLIAACAFCAHAFWRHWRFGFVIAAIACFVAAVLGPTLPAMKQALVQLGQIVFIYACRSVPRTAMQWGCAAVVTAFALLGIGAIVSRHKLSVATKCGLARIE